MSIAAVSAYEKAIVEHRVARNNVDKAKITLINSILEECGYDRLDEVKIKREYDYNFDPMRIVSTQLVETEGKYRVWVLLTTQDGRTSAYYAEELEKAEVKHGS